MSKRADIEERIEIPRLGGGAAPGRVTASARLYPGALMRKVRDARDANGVAPGAGDAVARASSSSGAALPADVQARFESSLGADLSGVRVHTGGASADAAGAVGARAYTTGNDIHFGAGQYAPADPFGLHLLAHEVAHTQQQGGAQVARDATPTVGADGWNDQYKSNGTSKGTLDAHSGSYDSYKKFLASNGETRATHDAGGHRIDGDVTQAELFEIFPALADDLKNKKTDQKTIDDLRADLNGAFRTMKIDTVEAQASYFANAVTESGQFRTFTETATSEQDRYQTDPSKLHLDNGYFERAAAGQIKNVGGYQPGGTIHAKNGAGWDQAFIGRGATQVTGRDYYIQCIAILEKRAAELDQEDPNGEDTKRIHEAITNIKADPAQAGNPKYAFLFSAAHLKMPIKPDGTTADESVTKGASATSFMGPQDDKLSTKNGANAKATEVLMRRARHQAVAAQQAEQPPNDPAGPTAGVRDQLHRAADPGAAAGTGAASGLDVSRPGDAAEVEADRMADAMVSGARAPGASASASGVSRAPAPAPAAGASDASGDAAAIVAAADKERAQQPPNPTETMLHGAEIASRLISGYLPEIASTWWVSGTGGSASVTGVKLEPQGKNVQVTVGRDFILRTEQASIGERVEELRAAFRAIKSDHDKQLLDDTAQLAAGKQIWDRCKAGEIAYHELQAAVGAPHTFARGAAQNGVKGASETFQPWPEALKPTALAIAEKQQALGLTVDGKAEDATLQAIGFVKQGKAWTLGKKTDWKAADAAESQTLADQKATAQKIGADANQTADGRRGSIVSFARQMIGTVDASDRGDGKKYGNVRVVDIYRTLGLLQPGDASKQGDLEAAGKVANETYGANLAKRADAIDHPDPDQKGPPPAPLSDGEKKQLEIYKQTGKVGDWSWCGIFAVYCVKASTGIGSWTNKGATGYTAISTGGDLEKFKAANPQPGDVLHIISTNQHHALLAEKPSADGKGSLSTVEGNVEAQGIRESTRFTYANVDVVYKPFA